MNKKLMASALVVAMTAGVSMGAINYNTTGGGAWETAVNWDGDALPGALDVARTAWGTTADSHTVTLNSSQTIDSLQNGVNRQGTVIIGAGGILTATGGSYNSIAWNDNDASHVILTNGGSWNITSNQRVAIGHDEAAVGSSLNIYSGSSLNISGGGDLEFNDSANTNKTTSFDYYATVHDGGSATVGRLQFNGGFGQLDIKDGGSVTMTTDQSGDFAGWITDGNLISSDGTLVLGEWGVDSVTISAIPEPATLGLVVAFGGAILFFRRNFRG
jgi:hypothetical protein